MLKLVIEKKLMSKIRKPAVAGLFYPADPGELASEIDLLLGVSTPAQIPVKLSGVILPHAGYIYSGRTAAFGFNVLKNKSIKNVIIVSPSHHEYFNGISIYDGDAYETPLGVVEVNDNIANKLTKDSKFIFRSTNGHRQEHAIEVQIPFLQRILSDFKIIPVVMGDQANVYISELSEKLADALDDNTIIIASSDLSHYHSKEEAGRFDSIVEERISKFDFHSLSIDIKNNSCEACGAGPIISMMKAAWIKGINKSIILNRSDSGDTSGDNSHVVGYLSAAIYSE